MKNLNILLFSLFIIVFSSCDDDLSLKKYEITYKDNKRDTLFATRACNMGDGYIGFVSKDGVNIGLYRLDDIQNYKVIEEK